MKSLLLLTDFNIPPLQLTTPFKCKLDYNVHHETASIFFCFFCLCVNPWGLGTENEILINYWLI